MIIVRAESLCRSCYWTFIVFSPDLQWLVKKVCVLMTSTLTANVSLNKLAVICDIIHYRNPTYAISFRSCWGTHRRTSHQHTYTFRRRRRVVKRAQALASCPPLKKTIVSIATNGKFRTLHITPTSGSF